MNKPNYNTPLTLAAARQLEGKTIRIMAAGYKGQDTDMVITMPKVMSKVEYYETLNEPCFAADGEMPQYKNRIDMWQKEMTTEKFNELYNESLNTYVIAVPGLYAYCYPGEEVFTIGDADRWAYYELV